MHILRYLMSGTALALALVEPAAAQDADGDEVIVVTGAGLDATPAAPAYDTQVIDRDQLVAAAGRIHRLSRGRHPRGPRVWAQRSQGCP